MISAKDLKDLFGESTPDRVILKAQKLAARGRNDQAVAVLKDGVARLGEIPDLRIEIATLCLSAGRQREAAESLRALLKSSPSQVTRVEEFIGWARSHHSEIEVLYEPLAEGHIARRNYKAAVDCLERINKKSLEATLEVRMTNLNRFLEKGAQVPKSALPTLYFSALGWEAIGDWQKTLDAYRRVLAASPGDLPVVDERLKGLVARHYKITSLRLAYAELLETVGQHKRAFEEHLTALEVDPRCAPQVGRFVETMLSAAPDDPDNLWTLARVRLAEGRVEEALQICGTLADRGARLSDIEKLLEDLSSGGKESVDTLLLLAKVALAQGKVPRALSAISNAIGNDAGEKGIQALEQVVAAHPSEPRAYQMLADCHLKAGRIDRSLEAYQSLRRVDTASSPLIANRLRAVLAADPNNARARQLMEEVCIEAGDIQEAAPLLRVRLRRGESDARDALERLRQMLLAAPSDAALKRGAAEACLALGDTAAAWGYLQDLVRADQPADKELLHLLVLCGGISGASFQSIQSHLSSLPPKWVDRPEVVFAVGEAAGRAGLVREAVERYRKAASLAPETAPVCRAAILSLAEKVKESGQPDDRAALAETLLDFGEIDAATGSLHGAGDLPAATASRLAGKLTEALRKNPGNLALSGALAAVWLSCGQAARALAIAKAAIADREDAASAPLAMLCGDALARSGKQADATRAYATAVKRDPGLAHQIIDRLRQVIQVDVGQDAAHLTLGRLLINEARVPEGVRSLMSAWSVKAGLAPVILKDLDQTGRRHPAEAAVDLARAQLLLAAGDPSGAASVLGARCGGAEPPVLDEIVARLEGIAAKNSECARAQLELGRAYLAKRWAARACSCLLRAYEQDPSLSSLVAPPLAQIQREFPDEPEAHIARGALYEGEGRVVAAAEAYLKAVCLPGSGASAGLDRLTRLGAARGPVPAEVHLILARACRLADDVSGSVAAARRALEAGPDHAAKVRAEMELLVTKHPLSAPARLGRASAGIHLLELEGAAQDLGEALRFDPSCSASVAVLAREMLVRRPSFVAGAVTLANALRLSGDDAGASTALDGALAWPEAGSDVDLILARRSLALKAGDKARAAALLGQAERACPSRDRLLERLHREALSARRESAASLPIPPEAARAVERGDLYLAAELLSGSPASTAKAWVLERCGRHAEAAACLREILVDERAAARFSSIHDEIAARELEGGAPALMGETTIHFEITNRGTKTLQGGVS